MRASQSPALVAASSSNVDVAAILNSTSGATFAGGLDLKPSAAPAISETHELVDETGYGF